MRLYRRGKSPYWTLDIRYRGERYVVSSRLTSQKAANAWARDFITKLNRGQYRPREDQVTFERLCELVRVDYINNGRRSLNTQNTVIKRLSREFAGAKAIEITTERIERYKANQMRAGYAKATVNADLSTLSLGLRLAAEQELLAYGTKPTLKRLNVKDNVRQGFVSYGGYLAIREYLPERLADLTDFLWWTGLRLGTGRQIEWRDVLSNARIPVSVSNAWAAKHSDEAKLDINRLEVGYFPETGIPVSRVIHIRSETVKTAQSHEIPITGEIANILERAAQYRSPACRYVFHRNSIHPILKDWAEVQWRRAAKKAGLDHILIHDLRRSFVRNMRLAGLPEHVIMQFTGHRSRDVFSRYNIVNLEEKTEALEKLSEYLKGQTQSKVKKIR